jgi:hypothetical protein
MDGRALALAFVGGLAVAAGLRSGSFVRTIHPPPVELSPPSRCRFCQQKLVDGRLVSGFTGQGPDWMTEDGDFGCDRNPISGEEGTGGHEPFLNPDGTPWRRPVPVQA